MLPKWPSSGLETNLLEAAAELSDQPTSEKNSTRRARIPKSPPKWNVFVEKKSLRLMINGGWGVHNETFKRLKKELGRVLADKSRLKIAGLEGLAYEFLSLDASKAQPVLAKVLLNAHNAVHEARKRLQHDKGFVYGADKIVVQEKFLLGYKGRKRAGSHCRWDSERPPFRKDILAAFVGRHRFSNQHSAHTTPSRRHIACGC